MVLRITGGSIVGALIAVITLFVWEVIGHTIFEVPAGLDPNKPEEARAYVAALPFEAKIWVVGGWLVAALFGGLVARALTGKKWPAWIPAIVILAATFANFVALPFHPWWMIAAGIAAPLLAGALLGGLPRFRRTDGAGDVTVAPGDTSGAP